MARNRDSPETLLHLPLVNSPAPFDATSVGVAIVNYNAGQHLLNCIQSVKDEGIVDIVVADNGSRDNSLEMLEQQHPDVKVVHLPNPGYGGGMNGAAKELSNEYLFILNPDAMLRPGSVKTLVETLIREPHAGIVGPRIVDSDDHLYPSARRFPSYFDSIGHATVGLVTKNNPWSRRYQAYDLKYDEERKADWVSGAAMLTRRNAYDAVNGFDDSYWMYMEDVDLCFRMHKAGWDVWFQPNATVFHVGGVSTSQVPFKLLAAHHRSLARFATRNATAPQRPFLPLIYAGLAARLGLLWLKTLKDKSARDKLATNIKSKGRQLLHR
jgi:N-acetylglucosaminyl-diphospho-decaprenol L-rhamnosyltransferase